jgi:DNA-binding beta-propeller fold protein YncE
MAKAGENAVVRCLLGLMALAGAVAGQYSLAVAFNATRAAAGWSIAVVAFLLLYALDPRGRELPAASESIPPAVEWPLLASVLALGVFFRTFHLSELPPGLNHDVAWEGMYAANILRGIPYTPYVSSAWGRETFMFYWDALSIKMFGMNLFAMTLPAVIAMILMMPFFYWWARSMFGAPLALVATLFLAVGGWPLVAGRVGWRAVLQPLFATITCLFFWRGMASGRGRDFLWSGVALALTLNTYNAARVLPILFPLYVVGRLIQHGRPREFARRYGPGLVIMLVAFAVCVAPLAWYALYNWVKFWGRAEAVYSGPKAILGNIKAAALLFNYWGNSDDFFVDTPILGVPAAVLFVFGLLWCLVRLRDERAAYLLLGMLVSMTPGIIAQPNANRCIGAMPFVFFFVGLGLLYFVRQAMRLGQTGGIVAGLVLLLASVGQTGSTYHEYLGHHRRRIWGFYPETTVLGRYMRTLVGQYAIWVGGANFPRDSLTFLSYPGEGDPFERRYVWLDDITFLQRFIPQPPPGRGLAIILSTIDYAPILFQQLTQQFPVHEIVELRYPPETGPVFARALLVPANEAPHPVSPAQVEPAGEVLWSGGRGSKPGQFNTPKGLARDAHGNFYVADTDNHRVQKFDAQGKFVAVWGERGSIPGTFHEPSAIGVDPNGDIHVVDTWNHRVQKLNPKGEVLTIYAPPKGFFGPRGIAFGKDRAYVTDGGNNFVDVFDLNGHFISKFGGAGSAPGQLTLPVGIALDRAGLIWVVDSGNNRLQAFRSDGTSVRIVPVPGWQGKDIKEGYLVRTRFGLILSDPINGHLFRLKGDQLEPIDTPLRLEGPSGLAADKTSVYVSERGRNAVSRFSLKER